MSSESNSVKAWLGSCQGATRRRGGRVPPHNRRHSLWNPAKMSDVATTASFGMVRDQGPIRGFGF